MNRTPASRRPLAVRISSAPEHLAGLDPLLAAAQSAVGDVPALLVLAKSAAAAAPNPGEGRTAFLWEILASVTAVDVAAGRAIEPHLDAAAILAVPTAPAPTAPGASSRQKPPACGWKPQRQTAGSCCTAPNPGVPSPPSWTTPS
jgi:hypothetical protein